MSTYHRPKNFTEIVRFRVERGLTGAGADAARQHRTTAGEYLRRALRAQLIADGVGLPPIDTPAQRDAAQAPEGLSTCDE